VLGNGLSIRTRTEADDPSSELLIRSRQRERVELEESEHRDQRRALIAINERLRLGDPMTEYRRLKCDAGPLIVRVAFGTAERSLERVPATQMIRGLFGACLKIAA
jgi:hypothetical protein